MNDGGSVIPSRATPLSSLNQHPMTYQGQDKFTINNIELCPMPRQSEKLSFDDIEDTERKSTENHQSKEMSFDAKEHSVEKLVADKQQIEQEEEEEEVVQITDQAPEFEIDLGAAFAYR